MTAGFSEGQSRALAILPKISGFSSVIFSSMIVLTVVRDRRKLRLTYHRLLLGISFTDISSSFWLGLSTWPIPEESNVWGAAGNEQTCSLQGFFTQFGISSSFYNASLSIYFLLVIRYGWKEARVKRIEPFLHFIPLVWALTTAITALCLRILGNAMLWCWISPQYDSYRWGLFYAPLWTMILVVSVNCIMIYMYVRQLENSTKKYRFESPPQDARQKGISSACSNESLSPMRRIMTGNFASSGNPSRPTTKQSENRCPATGRSDTVEPGDDVEMAQESSKTAGESEGEELKEESMSTNTERKRIGGDHPDEDEQERDTTARIRENSFARVSSLLRRISSRRRQHTAEEHRKRTKEVARQCFWFAGAFYINWVALSVSCYMLLV